MTIDAALAFDQLNQRIDAVLALPDLQSEAGLHTAVLISLFTDRRAEPTDVLPSQLGVERPPAGDPLNRLAAGERRGWWGDLYADVTDDQIGSKLWLLVREKQTDATLRRAKAYCEDALAWLTEDGITDSVDVFVEWTLPGVLGARITIARPDGTQATLRFDSLWSAS